MVPAGIADGLAQDMDELAAGDVNGIRALIFAGQHAAGKVRIFNHTIDDPYVGSAVYRYDLISLKSPVNSHLNSYG